VFAFFFGIFVEFEVIQFIKDSLVS